MTISEELFPDLVACHVAQNFWEFKTAVARSFVPLDVRSDRPEPFSGQIRSTAADQVSVSEISAGVHEVHRTQELIGRGNHRYYKLSLQLSGSGIFVQGDQESILMPGDMTIYSTHKPYSLCFEEDFRALVLMFPQHLLDLPVEMVGQLNAVRLPANDVLSGMVAPFLTQMAASLDQLTGATGSRITHSAIDLIATMLSAKLDLDRAGANRHMAMVKQIQEYIEENLSSVDLGPNQIARAHFISTRHLHGIFRDQGTTVSSWIRTRRLDRCRRDLVNPIFRDRPIAAIAARWGFVDAAHFSRVFKATYDQSPSDLRATIE